MAIPLGTQSPAVATDGKPALREDKEEQEKERGDLSACDAIIISIPRSVVISSGRRPSNGFNAFTVLGAYCVERHSIPLVYHVSRQKR